MRIDWHCIRPINGEQQKGFEEFVCQLARKEDIPNKNQFIRKGTPDAGVECFWILNDGTEWVWQAKYFTSSFGDSQWSQVDNSIKTIIEKHKRVTRIYIAIPVDPPDSREDGKVSMLEKWKIHIIKWSKWASDAKLKIEFIPWWNSDLIARLQKPENSGFILFWFDKESFTDEWFNQQIENSTLNLGNRYTPTLNFKLDIIKLFDGIAQDEKFIKQYHDKLDELLIKIKKIRYNIKDDFLSDRENKLEECCQFLENQYYILITSNEVKYDFNLTKKKLVEIIDIFSEMKNRMEVIKDPKSSDNDLLEYSLFFISHAFYYINEFIVFIDSASIKLYNTPFLLLDGEAGMGKSHLLADIANIRTKENKFSLLLLGQHFNNNDDPWSQILKMLHLRCNPDELLEALNSKAHTIGSRLIIFIDAINEGSGKTFWPDYLNGFIHRFSKYERLGLVLSTRSSYIKLFKSHIELLKDKIIRYTHDGFKNVEYEASKLFFESYGIESPNVPLLHPEFQRPLFLKLFCEGIKKSNLTKIPNGFQGITKIFDFYIQSINNRLSDPKNFNYTNSLNLVDIVIKILVKYKIENKLNYLPIEKAINLIIKVQREYNINGNLIDNLIDEGILSKDLYWNGKDYEEGIYIAYERLEDHLSAIAFLDNIPRENIEEEFKEKGHLFNFIKDDLSISRYKGIVESLSIQLPEKYGIELFELIDNSKENYQIAEAFVTSLLWRKNEPKLRKEVLNYINKTVLAFSGTSDYFWDTIIALSTNPNNYFNARKTHEILNKFSLADRDGWWTQTIHNWYNDNTSLKRLIDWAFSNSDKSHISDDSIELAAIMLSWFLVSTNRKLRDYATKALICLLEEKIHIVIRLLKLFEGINDPYIYERIYAVAYGCAMRTNRKGYLKELSNYIYKTIFNQEKVYPHVLLRDYARGVIEYSLFLGVELEIDTTKIRPPYRSDFPPIPSDEEIKKYEVDFESKNFKDHLWGRSFIIHSMEVEYTRDGKGAGYGDFGRYIFQSNFRFWDELKPVDFKNIAIKRIFDMGYNDEKHGKFDLNLSRNRTDRHYFTSERIGKKYQWIAMHELLAITADKYKMKAPWAAGDDIERIDFEGPWEPFIRDIDPTTVNRKNRDSIIDIQPDISYDNWDIENNEWLKIISDLPDPLKLINHESLEWIMLDGYMEHIEQKKLGEEQYSIPQKQFWYRIKSFFVKEQDFDAIITWLSDKNLMSMLPHSSDRYELFNREYYWSPGYAFIEKDYYGGDQVKYIYDQENQRNVGEVIITMDSYLWEAQYDFSKDGAIRLRKPCSILVNELKLNYQTNESYMYSNTGELICFDSSEGKTDHSCLYIKKRALYEFLLNKKHTIIWIVLGEKNIIGGHDTQKYGRWPVASGVYKIEEDKVVGITKLY